MLNPTQLSQDNMNPFLIKREYYLNSSLGELCFASECTLKFLKALSLCAGFMSNV